MIYYDPVAGLTIEEAIEEAIKMAKKANCIVQANLNDTILFITPMSDVNIMAKFYRHKKQIEYNLTKQKVK